MKGLKNYLMKATSGVLSGFLPPVHIYVLYKFWGKYSRRVDKRYCSCSCWDTVFKGTYESGIASYKHMYFNATGNTMKIWLITVACLITLYECLKHELKLLLNAHLRPLMAVLFVSSIFSHYYTWWVYVNYWNDDFYLQWNHQLFFTLTEIISTALVLHLSDSKRPISPKKVLIITSIAIIHILSGGADQFVKNVLWGEGYAHQVLRDLAFVVPDILHIVLPAVELIKNKKHNSHLTIDVTAQGSRKTLTTQEDFESTGISGGHLMSGVRGTKPLRKLENVNLLQEKLHHLNDEINTKSAQLRASMKKIRDIRQTISEMEYKSERIQSKYREILLQLKTELAKTEWESKALCSQINQMTSKKKKTETEFSPKKVIISWIKRWLQCSVN